MRRFLTNIIRDDLRAAAALEAAMVFPILVPLLFGGIEVGLMWWTNGTLQSVAAMTARCMSTGALACSNPQQYAVTLATNWLGAALISTSNVTVTPGASKCQNASGSFNVVTISVAPWNGSIVYPFKATTNTLTACYPT